MKKYKVTGRKVGFNAPERLELEPNQAGPRMHCLNFVKGKVYEVTAPVEFKQGEEIGYAGEMNKALSNVLEPVNNKAEKAAKKKAPTPVKIDVPGETKFEDLEWPQIQQLAADKAKKEGVALKKKDKKTLIAFLYAEPAAPEKGPEDAIELLGSSVQPSIFKLKDGTELQLGEVVRTAFDRTDFETAKEWNALPEEEREQKIQEVVSELDLADDGGLPLNPPE